MFKGQAKAPITLLLCAGWSEPLLVAHTTLLEISCRGSIIKKAVLYIEFQSAQKDKFGLAELKELKILLFIIREQRRLIPAC